MAGLLRQLPKAELHLHVEGTLEPEMMFRLAKRNEVELPFASIDAVRAAYEFTNLQSFLDIYYAGAAVLRTEEDFYDLMMGYLDRAAEDGVAHAEVFFDPQTHTERGIRFEAFMAGFRQAFDDAKRWHGVTGGLILCFLRHLSGAAALETIEQAEPHLEGVIAVGLDSSEVGNPPERFVEAYDRARTLGLRAVAHAGEEGPASYVTRALDILGAERIDHGIRSLEDPELVARLRAERTPLTVCPLSNVALQVVPTIEIHPLPRMLDEDLMVSINSDDPAYFGGYVGDNYRAIQDGLGLDRKTLIKLAKNSIESSFMDVTAKAEHLATIDALAVTSDG